jgi:hypothetical protein
VVNVQVGSSLKPQHLLFLGRRSGHISLPLRDHLLLESFDPPSLLLGVPHPHRLSFAFISGVRMSLIFHSPDGTHPVSRMTPIATVKTWTKEYEKVKVHTKAKGETEIQVVK